MNDQNYSCPHCGHAVRVYRRKINSGMALWLVAFYKILRNTAGVTMVIEKKTIHSRAVLNEMKAGTCSRDAALLRHWGLIAEEIDGSSKRTGRWRITPEGVRFVLGYGHACQYAEIQNNRLLRLSGDAVTVRECLGDKFDLDEMLGRDKEKQAAAERQINLFAGVN